MPVKLRLQRFGKKANAFYHIVVADGRAPRDGKFIEKIGTYNPNTNPATIDLNFDKALDWLHKGAQPTDTMRAILSYKGVLFKDHLDRGVAKGVVTQELADAKFNAWLEEKGRKIEDKKKKIQTDKQSSLKDRIAAETKKREEIAKAVLAKSALAEEAAKAAKASEAPAAAASEAPAEAASEAPAAAVSEAPAEAASEAPAVTDQAAETTPPVEEGNA